MIKATAILIYDHSGSLLWWEILNMQPSSDAGSELLMSHPYQAVYLSSSYAVEKTEQYDL